MSTRIPGTFALLILVSTVAVHAQTCSGMSLGDAANLNGFVPFPASDAWNTNIASAAVDPNSAAITSASGFTGLHLHHDFWSTANGYGIPYTVVDSTTTPSTWINVIDYAARAMWLPHPIPPTLPSKALSPTARVGRILTLAILMRWCSIVRSANFMRQATPIAAMALQWKIRDLSAARHMDAQVYCCRPLIAVDE